MSANETLTKVSTDQTFEGDVLKHKGLSIVDFWAEWCGPCRVLGPSLDAMAEEYQGRAEVYKVNVDENPNTPARFHIRGLPTVLLFRDGVLVDQIVGAVPREVLKLTIDKHL